MDLHHIAKVAYNNAPSNLRFPNWLRILHWMEQISTDPMVHGEWVTWYELLCSLQINVGGRGVQSTGTNNTWKWDDAMRPYDMQKTTRNFSSWLTQVIKLVHPTWKSKHARPSCYRFQTWAMTLKIAWNAQSKNRYKTGSRNNWELKRSRRFDSFFTWKRQAWGSRCCAAPIRVSGYIDMAFNSCTFR